jgi:hypothetical protein
VAYRFIPRSFFVYNEKEHAWLSLKGDWTRVFWEARDYPSEEQAFNGPWPEGSFDDCYILAWDGTFERNSNA